MWVTRAGVKWLMNEKFTGDCNASGKSAVFSVERVDFAQIYPGVTRFIPGDSCHHMTCISSLEVERSKCCVVQVIKV